MRRNIEVKIIDGYYRVIWAGKIAKTFTGPNAKDEANTYAQALVDDLRWNDSNNS